MRSEAKGKKEGPVELTAQLGAAALMVTASRKGKAYTEIERQKATNCLMKVFHLSGPKAAALRSRAEQVAADTALITCAEAAGQLPADDRESVVTALWSLLPEGRGDALMNDVAQGFAVPRERLDALRPSAS